jgi:Dehydrogenase E1 component/Caspase domain
MAARRALLVAAGQYEDAKLGVLRAPTGDVRSLAAVLSDPKIGDFRAMTALDMPLMETQERIHTFCQEAERGDTLLLYFSGHGILAVDGTFYFATKDTVLRRVISTAVPQGFIKSVLRESRASTKIVVLDCCHSGAFHPGFSAKGNHEVDVSSRFTGRGDVVLTASTALEYAFEYALDDDGEGERITSLDGESTHTSVFTSVLIEGLATGDADIDKDGLISVDDLYTYVFSRVRERSPAQTPSRGGTAMGQVIIAKSVMGRTVPTDLRRSINSRNRSVRLIAVNDLLDLSRVADEESFPIFKAELVQLAHDTHEPVADAAKSALTLLGVPLREESPETPTLDNRGFARLRATDARALDEFEQAVTRASTLVGRIRSHGHLAARLDPLGSEPEGDPGLDPEALGLTPELLGAINARNLSIYVPGATLADALPHLRETYCGTIAYEIEHIASHRQRVWLREHIESGAFRHDLTSDERRILLKRLVEVDALERFMHKAYLGQHQFSIEGLDMTVPMLDELIQLSAVHGGQEVMIGMAHRGRLNVLAHNLGRSYDTIFGEFEGASTLEAVTTIPQGGTGDVKYHHGTQGTYKLPSGDTIRVNLESNPSHLEYVSPVVEGATRAAQTTRQGPHAHQDTNAAVPIVIHGDASFPGQGVVSETFNLQALDGYKVGGTVHLIMNNQIGFTTDLVDDRSQVSRSRAWSFCTRSPKARSSR